jgi:hypothetical protein
MHLIVDGHGVPVLDRPCAFPVRILPAILRLRRPEHHGRANNSADERHCQGQP